MKAGEINPRIEFKQVLITTEFTSKHWEEMKQFSEFIDAHGISGHTSFVHDDITYEVILNTDTSTIVAYHVEDYVIIDPEVIEYYLDEYEVLEDTQKRDYFAEMIQAIRNIVSK